MTCRCTSVVFDVACPIHGEAAKQLLADAIREDRLIHKRPAQTCALCGAEAETRPYGPKGEELCYSCANSTPELRAAAEAAMARRFGG